MKQTTYIMAKQHPVNPPELFASILATHFTSTYAHIHTATVKVVQHRWTRMTVDGAPHPHSFFRDGAEKRVATAVSRDGSKASSDVDATGRAGIDVHSAISGLLVLKSTGSAFHGFNQDEYTVLQPTKDRILSTEVDCGWAWRTFASLADVEAGRDKFDNAWTAAREITMKTFAVDDSASVQNTMYKLCDQILAVEGLVEKVDYSLPNKHYFEIGELILWEAVQACR